MILLLISKQLKACITKATTAHDLHEHNEDMHAVYKLGCRYLVVGTSNRLHLNVPNLSILHLRILVVWLENGGWLPKFLSLSSEGKEKQS